MNVKELEGKTLVAIHGKKGDEEIIFTTDTNEQYRMYHQQDCCESVDLEDIVGDLDDLIGSPILQAEESTSNDNLDGAPKSEYDSFTWTFYKLGTIKGYVTLRWYGESNGWYSESVDFEKIELS